MVSDRGPGVSQGASHVQRLNTVGGQAPATPGIFTNQLAEVPCTADYYLYRAP